MTQNTFTGSQTDMGRTDMSRKDFDKDSDDQSSNEIRADIDHTRASVGDKIDQLQARLDPNRLKQQAQETVQEMLTDTANSMTDYVRTHKDEMISSLANSARRNPLPTALVGLGLGWLLLESLGGNKSDDRERDYDYERRMYGSRNRFEGSTGRSDVAQGRGQFMSGEGYSSADYDAPDYGSSGYPTQAGGTQRVAGQEFSNKEFGNGHHRNPLEKATDAVKDTVGDVADKVKETVGDVTHDLRERVDGAGQEIRERVGDVRRQAGRMGDQGQNRLHRANEQMHEFERSARYQGQRRGQQVMRNLEDNPLTYGAVALAAGAALALFLPQTRTENRAFGEMRDQIMERGQEVMESAKSHAQEVVEEVRPELEEKVRQIAQDVKETVKETGKEAAAELRPVVDKAMAKGKEEASAVAKDAGIDPNKLGSNKPALNRDTLAGQWKQVRGEVKSKWGQLTDDELTRVEGDFDKLVGAIQTRYGYTRERSEQEINEFFKSRKS